MVPRRTVIRGALASGATAIGASLTGCSDSAQSGSTSRPAARPSPSTAPEAAPSGNSVLLAYFSRSGENYYYGDRIDLEVGNTEVLAGMIADRIDCDVHKIEPVDAYPYDYEKTVEQNAREQEADARPEIANPLDSITSYEVVLLASPIWNVRTPMIMSTFTEALDFTGITVHPVTTHAMSGLGDAPDNYAATCRGAAIGDGLAVRGEEVRDAGAELDGLLRRIDLSTARQTTRSR